MTLLSFSPVTLTSLSEASTWYPQHLIRRLVTAGSSLIQQSPRTTLPAVNDLSIPSIAALLLTVIAGIFAIATMSWRDPFNFWRRTPSYGSSPQPSSPPQVRDSDFAYLTPDDIVDPPRQPQYVERRPHTHASSDESGPDIILLKHRGVTYPLHFPPYAIDDGDLTIGEIRRRAAEKMGTSDPRRIKMLYKGKLLRDDPTPCKDEGLKQHSELMCVVSDVLPGESTSDLSASENEKSEAVSADSIDRPKKKKNKKKNKKKDKHGQSQRNPETPADGGLAPPTDQRPTSSGRSSAAPSPAPSLQNLRTGNDQVDALLQYFRTELVPLCEEYISHPPTDPKPREFEYKRLSETVLAQVILKADGIESEDARVGRRALIKEAQAMLNRLDEAAHRKDQ